MGKQSIQAIAVAGTLGVFAAVSIITWNNGTWPVPSDDSISGWNSEEWSPDRIDASHAIAYAEALRDDDCRAALDMTLWVEDRLERVRIEGDEPEAERARLCDELLSRPLEGNHISSGGIEDAYVFRPGVEIEPVGVDPGPEDLERPAAHRVWLRVTFPSQTTAPLDEEGKPVRSLRAGVSVSRDGYILKAGVVGNIEIDETSLTYDWKPSEGG